MKRVATLLLAIAAGTFARSAHAQGPVPTAPQSTPQVPWANKFFLPDIAQNPTQVPPPMIAWDFKDVPHGTLCSHTFTITNIYDEPMQVVEVRKSCHCLDYVPMPQMLKPNETANFTVTMNTGKFVGHNAQTLYVTFGPKFISTAVIKLSATSKADVTLSPGAVAFGTVPLGTSRTEAVEVEYRGAKLRDANNKTIDWKIVGVLPNQAPVDVKINEVKPPGFSIGLISRPPKFRVDVTLKPTAPPGPIGEQVSLTTNDPNNPVVQVMLTGNVQAPIEVAPQIVRFDSVGIGQEATQRVIVRAGKPFRVIQVDGQDDRVSVELPPTTVPLPVNVLTIKFRPSETGPTSRVLRIHTDLDGKVIANLPVEGEGTK